MANFDDSTKPGTHWVALFARNPVHVFYFDSLGLGEDCVEDIKNYIQKNFMASTQQHTRLQRSGTTVCGHFALFFIYCMIRGLSFLQIESLLALKRYPEKYVRDFVHNIIMK